MMPDNLILMDAYSQIFRCFFAVRELTNGMGEPVNALLPFCRMLLNLEKLHPGRRGAIVFDCGKVQFRMNLCPDYKANRPPAPDALKQQVPFIRELCELFGWPLLEEPEYEADDLIAALALNYSGPVRIISSDKDLAQLVDSRIAMLVPGTGKNTWELRDEAQVTAKFAVRPDQIVDYLALLGDAADNIPGVPGIGPKTAAAVLNRCNSITEFFRMENPPVAERIAGLLRTHRDRWELNRQMIVLRTDLPGRLQSAESCCVRKLPDWEAIRKFCMDKGVRSLLKDLPQPDVPAEEDLFSPASVPETRPAEKTDSKPVYEQGSLFGDDF